MSSDGSLRPFVSQETDEWSTPPEFVRPLSDAVGGFDLDPCSGAETSPVADATYTEADDGLAQTWFGHVWLNPPYSDMDQWLSKTVRESRRECVDSIIALVKGDTSTEWYHKHAIEADVISFVKGRLSFGERGTNAPFASHVLVYGDVPADVFDVLSNHGVVFPVDAYQQTEQARLSSVPEDSNGRFD